MFSFECLMAIALLTAPQGPGGVPLDAARHRALVPALRTVCVALEILDRREVQHILARPEEFAADVNLLRARYQSLAGAPRLADCQRLPDRDLVNNLLSANRTYRQYLVSRQTLDLIYADDVRAALDETDRLYEIWDAVRDSRCSYYYVTVRRQALVKLLDMVGAEAFYRAELPPHVPVWRIPEIN